MLVNVVKSNRIDKRYKAIFSNGKAAHFGSKFGSNFLDHRNIIKRFNYLKRHQVNEDWSDPYTSGALSAYLLWGNNYTMDDNIFEFNRVFFNT